MITSRGVCFLENVKGFAGLNRGRTPPIILRKLEENLGYHVRTKVINARHFGAPRNRKRVFIVAFRHRAAAERFAVPEPPGAPLALPRRRRRPIVTPLVYRSNPPSTYLRHTPC
jgi:site-specific DNA-cytosine methylase